MLQSRGSIDLNFHKKEKEVPASLRRKGCCPYVKHTLSRVLSILYLPVSIPTYFVLSSLLFRSSRSVGHSLDSISLSHLPALIRIVASIMRYDIMLTFMAHPLQRVSLILLLFAWCVSSSTYPGEPIERMILPIQYISGPNWNFTHGPTPNLPPRTPCNLKNFGQRSNHSVGMACIFNKPIETDAPLAMFNRTKHPVSREVVLDRSEHPVGTNKLVPFVTSFTK